MKMKNDRRKKVLIYLSLVLILTSLWSFTGSRSERYFEIAKNLDIFATLFKEVNAYYVDEVNPNKLMRTGIEAMLKTLDPYTNYIPEDDIEDYRTLTTGQYGGIGAIIGTRNGKNLVIMPYEGFPAHSAGLKIGDQILEVNGVDVSSKQYTDISKLLKGQANTDVKLVVKRYGIEEPMIIELKRAKITIDNVPYHGMIEDDIAYIRLTDFTMGAGKEVRNALSELKQQGATRVILDLRGNPGGLLTEAVNVSNVFIPKGSEVVSTKGKVTDWNKTYRALDPAFDTDMPVVILTSSTSASASEIVSGVIQDYDRGVLVGQKTFGKGLVQATRPLTYNSQLKVTTAKYYTPSGRCIQAIDYSHRNADGSVGKVPDSLKVEFTTRNGRVVYDGGGVDPDILVDKSSYSNIAISLLRKNLLFDYATEYAYSHESIKAAREFKLTDAEYTAFVNWLSDKDYDYTTKVEENLEELAKNAKNEKYFSEIESQINELREDISHNKERDLQMHQEEIRNMLEQEIVSRYYLETGMVDASFDDDEDITAAISILNNSEKYSELLKGE